MRSACRCTEGKGKLFNRRAYPRRGQEDCRSRAPGASQERFDRRGGHSFTRLEKLNLTQAQREDAINYEASQVIEFHRRAAGGFKSGQQWQVIGSQGQKEIVVERNGERRFLPLTQAGKFSLFRAESIGLSVGDTIRITKNFRSGATRFRNNELHTVTAVEAGKVTLVGVEFGARGALHLDQGIVVTSHASQGKTVDQVIVSVPVESFSQANEAQFYVSMSRARKSMHLFTDSKVALREAVARKSARLSPWELIAGGKRDHTQKELTSKPTQKESREREQERDLQYAGTR
jgi:hypothetical protein